MSLSRATRKSSLRAIVVVMAAGLLSMRAQPTARRNQGASVFVGVLRPDGLLIPTAIHDGTDWWNRWPFSYESDESVERLVLPASVGRIPADWLPPGVQLPQEWRVQLNAGGSATIRLGRPARPKAFSLAAMVGVSTSYHVPASVKPSAEGDDSELGIAVAGDATLGRFGPVGDTQSEALLAALTGDIQLAESEEIAFRIKERQSQPDWNGHPVVFPVDGQQRKLVPMSSSGFLRANRKEEGRTFYYFTAQKDYGPKPWPDCYATVDFDGIVVQEATGNVSARSLRAYTAFECSRDNAINAGFRPLATLHWRGATLWVVRIDAEDGFEYSLIDPAAADPATAVSLKGLWQLRVR